jgi:hypothetical protein
MYVQSIENVRANSFYQNNAPLLSFKLGMGGYFLQKGEKLNRINPLKSQLLMDSYRNTTGIFGDIPSLE